MSSHNGHREQFLFSVRAGRFIRRGPASKMVTRDSLRCNSLFWQDKKKKLMTALLSLILFYSLLYWVERQERKTKPTYSDKNIAQDNFNEDVEHFILHTLFPIAVQHSSSTWTHMSSPLVFNRWAPEIGQFTFNAFLEVSDHTGGYTEMCFFFLFKIHYKEHWSCGR